jgi:hypothetical protein
MKPRTLLAAVVTVLALVQVSNASSSDNLKTYFSDTATRVKATADPAAKRETLSRSLQTMTQALQQAEALGLVAPDDRAGFDGFQASLQAKQDELKGTNGYGLLADAELNAFSDYVVQDMEQAAETVHISLVAALLIIIILILIQ